MSTVGVGSLFSGYSGLEMGVTTALALFGITTSTAWVSDIDPGACRILAHRLPDVPNLGDITRIDWSAVTSVEIVTAGFPCQDVSTAGRQAGLRPGTRTGLWSHVAYAIDSLRPGLVVLENVRGLLNAPAHCDVEPCSWCLGDGAGEPLRALGAVLADLADLGYDARWVGIPASGVGAPHQRLRIFILAYPADAPILGHEWVGGARAGWHGSAHGDATCLTGALLPTPAVNDMGASYTPDEWDEWTDRMKADHQNGNGHGKSLSIEAQRLLPTPTGMDSHSSGGNPETTGTHGTTLTDATARQTSRWGVYAEAIARWENLTRPAPAPTQTSSKGKPQLAPAFSEWMMGLPEGWVTDPSIWAGLTNKRGRVLTGTQHASAARNAQLRALGNGVVPQQACAAVSYLLSLGDLSGAPSLLDAP